MVLLDGDAAVREPVVDPSRSTTVVVPADAHPARRPEGARTPRPELTGLSRLSEEIERFASWTAGVSLGSHTAETPQPPDTPEDLPAVEPAAGAVAVEVVAAGDPSAKQEPHRSGVFARAFKRR